MGYILRNNRLINAVSIDVSRVKNMVTILKPHSEIVISTFEIKHTSRNLDLLVELTKSVDGESFVVMEHTGRYL